MATTNIHLRPDGKYCWVHEFNLYTNPTILLMLLKIFFWIYFCMWAFLVLLDVGNSWYGWDDFLDFGKWMLVFFACFSAFCTVCYYIYALVMGGKYCVLFEMDDKGVRHKQMPKQVKKAQILSALGFGLGAARGSLSGMGTSALAGARSEMYSEFGVVKSVEVYRRRGVIKVNALLNYNQVYAAPEDFDWVLQYILDRIPKKAKVRR
ncbi:MAG: hypothetical protein Q4B68_00780 [Bacteroidales bacterium]|nr:hypothetical protein [Bacteroidales bacterium]